MERRRSRNARLGNALVTEVLRSPVHGLLSGSTDVIRYIGRRSGRQITTPTQYARHGDDVVILAGRPDTKTWWRNFESDHDIEVLLRGRWLKMIGRAVVGANDQALIAPLLDAYLERFPRVAHTLGATPEARAEHAVIVWCRPARARELG